MVLSFEGISHVLLDIEGTTCPVSFVSNTLFPYASAHLGDYLERHGGDPAVQALVKEVRMLWQEDPDPEARALLQSGADKRSQTEPEERTRPQDLHERQRLRMPLPAVEPYLQWLIRRDRKVTALKDLQGRIWQEGYTNGELQGPLYRDVPEALRRWSGQGLVLGVYSSGSVPAQQQLYGHSSAGDLRSLFRHWFDTRSGAKQEAASYRRISHSMEADPGTILFVSDVPAELDAASEAGYQVLFSHRPGNPHQDGAGHPAASSYAEVLIEGLASVRA
jgi:enolase-phosphatase E1